MWRSSRHARKDALFGADKRHILGGAEPGKRESGHRISQVQQAADRAYVGANLIRRYIVFIVSFPMRKQGFDGFFAVGVANGFDWCATAQCGNPFVDPALDLFL